MHDVRDFIHPQGIEINEFGVTSHSESRNFHENTPGFDGVNERWSADAQWSQLLETSVTQEDTAEFTLRLGSGEVPLSRRHRHRRVQASTVRRKPTRGDTLSIVTTGVTVAIVAAVCVLGGAVTHNPLRHLAGADTAPREVADWWPLLVYGPWMVASLSILRAALHQRRAPHSWCVVLLFSAFAIVLCIDQAPRTITSATVASLPTIATVACFHQLVRQITLTRPPRRGGVANRRAPIP
jgi:hypothetical protein